jgi:glycosyltransferase involved in cell wall biosynthesis
MRILFLDQFSDLGGAQLCLLDLLPAIRARGWEAFVAAPRGGPLLERAEASGIERLRLGSYTSGSKAVLDYARFGWDVLAAGRQIAAMIRRFSIDLVYVNGPRVLAATSWGRGELPVVFHCHSFVERRLEAALVRWYLRRMRARVIANCRYVTRPFQAALGDTVSIIYNGVADAGRPRVRDDSGPACIGVIGRIAPEKGQMEFARAARLILQTGLPCRFLICGGPRAGDPVSERYSRELSAEAGGLPIEFTGWRDEVGDVLREMDLLVVPSSVHEATTRVIPEAFSAAVPVVAARAGGIAEIVDHGQTGWLVDSMDPETLALAIASVLRKPRGELRAAGIRARKAWQDRFRLERWRERVLGVLEEVSRDPAPLGRR